MNARRAIPEEPRQKHWGEFFLAASLVRLMSFDEFMREPEAIVAALTDGSAPLPASLPVLDARIESITRRNPARPAAGGEKQQQPADRSQEATTASLAPPRPAPAGLPTSRAFLPGGTS